MLAPPSGVDKVEGGCTATNLPLSDDVTIVSELNSLMSMLHLHSQPCHSKVWQSKIKNKFLPFTLGWHENSQPHQTQHGDRRGPYNVFISKTCSHLMYVFTPMSAENMDENAPLTLNHYNAGTPGMNPSKY